MHSSRAAHNTTRSTDDVRRACPGSVLRDHGHHLGILWRSDRRSGLSHHRTTPHARWRILVGRLYYLRLHGESPCANALAIAKELTARTYPMFGHRTAHGQSRSGKRHLDAGATGYSRHTICESTCDHTITVVTNGLTQYSTSTLRNFSTHS